MGYCSSPNPQITVEVPTTGVLYISRPSDYCRRSDHKLQSVCDVTHLKLGLAGAIWQWSRKGIGKGHLNRSIIIDWVFPLSVCSLSFSLSLSLSQEGGTHLLLVVNR